ncbi:MAG TPA: hypothetical protein PLS49_04965 [Candidatus Woesebacteria bacterium]|nr:hypothetical protein [Candidatus Woesebacteria bacterium]
MKSSDKKEYISPKISIKKVRLNFFYSPDTRLDDSLNNLLGVNILAQSGSCGGSSSKGAETPI